MCLQMGTLHINGSSKITATKRVWEGECDPEHSLGAWEVCVTEILLLQPFSSPLLFQSISSLRIALPWCNNQVQVFLRLGIARFVWFLC